MAVLFYYRQEMRLLEVAEVLGVTAGTVKTLLHRARKKLRRDLEENQGRESNAFEILGPMSLIETLSLTLFMVGFFGLLHFDTTKADTQL